MYQHIASHVNYGGLTLKNPIVLAPTSMGLSREELTQRLVRVADPFGRRRSSPAARLSCTSMSAATRSAWGHNGPPGHPLHL